MNKPSDIEGFHERLLALRLEFSGRRGQADFARMLDLSPSTYYYYEKNRVPPVPVLVRLSRRTGVAIQWLLTGEGPKYLAQAADGRTSPVPPDLLDQIGTVLARAPHLKRPIQAFVALLEQTGDWPVDSSDADARPRSPQPEVRRQPAWIPVLGRTAAGPAHFWRDYNPESDADTFGRRIDQWVLGAREQGILPGLTADPADGPPLSPGTGRGSVNLVQLSAPDQRGLIEFLDCPDVASRYPRAVAWRVDGDSMSPRYEHGDLVVCSPEHPAADGRPAVVRLHGQIGITCKIYRTTQDGLRLCPVNERYEPIEAATGDLRWGLRVLFRVRTGG